MRLALRAALELGEGTSLELRQRACTGRSATTDTLNNMCRAGEVRKVASVRRVGVKRPVPVYALADPQAEALPPGSLLQDALRTWGVARS